jgi:uncharacterized protein (DUF1501 family)
MRLSRRHLLTRLAPQGGQRLFFRAEDRGSGDTLVVVFLRGGMDALHTVPPFGDLEYRSRRPTLAIPEPGAAGGAVDLDGFFGLHLGLAPLADLFQERRLAIVHAFGSPDTTLSHFEAMQTMERGVDDGRTTATGWLTRHLAASRPQNPSPLRAVAFGDVLPKSLQGALHASAIRSLDEFRLTPPDTWEPDFSNLLGEMYALGDDPAHRSGRSTLQLLARLEDLAPANGDVGGSAYPDTAFGRGLRQAAQLLRAEVGLEVAALDLAGWDSHVVQAPLLAGLMDDLARGLAAFHADLGDEMSRVTVAVMSEFGRRVRENSGLGTDHGRATAMFVLGGGIRGGKVYGKWPGLGGDQLDRDGNLRVTTDYRSVLAEILDRRIGNPQTGTVFPSFQPTYLNLCGDDTSLTG